MARYRIQIKEQLAPERAAWFPEMRLHRGEHHSTILIGELADQAALHGVLLKVRDLGLTLVAVQTLDGCDDFPILSTGHIELS